MFGFNFTERTQPSINRLTYIVLLCLAFGISYSSTNWPNEPAGAVNVLDCPFSNNICGMWNTYNTQSYANFSNAPLSPSSVFDTYMAAGSMSGNGQWGYSLPNAREVYVGTWWSTNPEFQGYSNNTNKMIFVRRPEIDNSFLCWQGMPDQPKTLKWYQQAAYDNCGHPGEHGMCYSAGDGTGWFEPNGVSSGTVAAGSGWHRIEIYLKSSTTKTSRDGIVRWWLDGQLVGNYPTVNLSPGGFQDFQINHAWDGSGACGGPGVRDCSRAWHHYWDHLRISIPNGAPLVPTSMRIIPSQPMAEKNKGLQLAATVMDQNGFPLVNQPSIAWSTTGSNTISNGLFLAGSATGDFTVTATSGSLTATTTVKVMDFVPVNLKINCGSNKPAVPGWESDTPYLSPGNMGATFDNWVGRTISTAGVANAAPAAVYNTVRRANHAYTFTGCPNGNYLVRLHFVDGLVSNRAMDYTIEGVKVIDNLNIVKEAGGIDKALVKEFNVTVSDNNGLQIVGNQDAGNDVFEAGIEIIRNGTADISSNGSVGGMRMETQFTAKTVAGKVVFNLPQNSNGNYNVSIFDLVGKKVYEHKASTSEKREMRIETALKNGIYFAKFSQGREMSTVRFNVMK